MVEGRGIVRDMRSPQSVHPGVASTPKVVQKAPSTPKSTIRKAPPTPRSTVTIDPSTPKSTIGKALTIPMLAVDEDEDDNSDSSPLPFVTSLDLEDQASPSKKRKREHNSPQIMVVVPTPSNKLALEARARDEVLRKVAYSSSGDAFFDSLDPSLLRSVFHTLRLELKRLFLQENTLEKWRPQADKFLYTHEAQTMVLSPKDAGPWQPVIDKWSYTGADQLGSPTPFDVLTDWNGDSLAFEKPYSKLFKKNGDFRYHPLDYGSFSQRISSQLLLYRITLVFGTVPTRDEEEEIDDSYCWETTLYHKDQFSLLDLWDINGVAHVWFQGSWDAETDALEVLNMLCGNQISQQNGKVAGTPG